MVDMIKLGFEAKSIFHEIEAVLFDFDGTLFDLDVNWSNLRDFISKTYYNRFGNPIKDSSNFTSIFSQIRKEKGISIYNEYLLIIKEWEENALDKTTSVPKWITSDGMPIILEHIDKNTHMGIVSSNFHSTIQKAVNRFRSLSRISTIIGRDDIRNLKPDPEGLIKICSIFGCSPAKSLYIGDQPTDNQAALSINMNFVYEKDLIEILRKEIE